MTNANFVNQLAYDPGRRVVWAATNGGIVRWSLDGTAYEKQTALDIAVLPTSEVYAVAVEPVSGDVWIGTPVWGALRYDQSGRWSRVPEVPGGVSAITVDASTGDVWFASSADTAPALVWRSAAGRWHTFAVGDAINEIAVNATSGDVWLATRGGAERFQRDGTHSRFTVADGLPHDIVQSVTVEPSSGRVWFGTADGLAYWQPGDGLHAMGQIEGTDLGSIRLVAVAGGELWVADSTTGLWVNDADGIWRSRGDELTGRAVTALAEAEGGQVWLGMQGGGGIAVDAEFGRWRMLRTADEVPGGILRLYRDPAGEVVVSNWFALGRAYYGYGDRRGLGLYRWHADGSWENVIRGVDPLCAVVSMVEFDRVAGGFWTASDFCSGDVYHHLPSGPTTYEIGGQQRVPPIDASVIRVNQHTGDVWVGTVDAGVHALLRGTQWQAFTRDSGLTDDHVTALMVEPSGDVWVGTAQGASRRSDGGRWVQYDRTAGLAGEKVYDIAADPQTGDVWLATDNGAARIAASGRITNFTVAGGLPARDIVAVMVDPIHASVWLRAVDTDGSVIPGLVRIDPADGVSMVTPKEQATVYVLSWSLDARTGAFWLATSDGAYVLGDDGTWQGYLPGKYYSGVLPDPQAGSVWLEEPLGGLTRLWLDPLSASQRAYLPFLYRLSPGR